ncbi:MAG: hypothetical protein ACJAR1_002782 [Rubritalea sp.]|jgi:hypothetical protein
MSEQQNRPRSNNNRGQNNNRNRNRSNNSNRNNSNSNSNRKPRQNKPKPLVLSTWQKILIFCKLTTENKIRKQLQANRPARNQTKANTAASNKTNDAKPARTNTRVAKEQQAPQKVDVETPRLYIGNLSYDATEYDIEDLFKGIGSVKSVEIIYNRHTHKSKGYGFVQMLNVDEAKRAVDVLHDQPFLGRNLIVNGSKARKASDPNSHEYVAENSHSEETSEELAT